MVTIWPFSLNQWGLREKKNGFGRRSHRCGRRWMLR